MHRSVLLLLSLPLAGGWWVGLKHATFDEARSACSHGDLATFSSNQELSELLRTNPELRRALESANRRAAHFWIGLEKPKDLCVVQDLDQRGFRFVDRRNDSKLNVWREEPRDTCTNVRCGAVALDSASWGLVSLSCKNKNHFICGPAKSGPRPDTRPESGPEARPETTQETRPGTTEESRPEEPNEADPNLEQTRLSPGLGLDPGVEPEETTGPGNSSSFMPNNELDQTRPTSGPEPGLVFESKPPSDQDPNTDHRPEPSPEQRPDQTVGQTPAPSSGAGPGPSLGSGPSPASGPCSLPVVPRSRSLSLDDSEPGQVSVECWSGEILLLRCVDGVWIWTRPDSEPGPYPSPVSDPGLNVSSVFDPALNVSEGRREGLSEVLSCSDCGPGFKFVDGECDDIDECALSPAPCAHGCVNARGSFTCTPAPLSNALVHSLIAVAAVTLAVIAVITTWCCIRTRRRDEKPDQDLNQNQTEA